MYRTLKNTKILKLPQEEKMRTEQKTKAGRRDDVKDKS
jgi:hypothetical protein